MLQASSSPFSEDLIEWVHRVAQKRVAQQEVTLFQFIFAGLDLEKLGCRLAMPAGNERPVDDFEITVLPVIEIGVQRQVSMPIAFIGAVDFVAHAGEKLALALLAFLGGFFAI
jgi:hypothetical protein